MKLIEESLAKAAESVELDPSDGLSWVVLGNSYLVSFFSILQTPKKMKQALAAYLQAVSYWHHKHCLNFNLLFCCLGEGCCCTSRP